MDSALHGISRGEGGKNVNRNQFNQISLECFHSALNIKTSLTQFSPTLANLIQLLHPFTIIYIATGLALVRIITIKLGFIMNEKNSGAASDRVIYCTPLKKLTIYVFLGCSLWLPFSRSIDNNFWA